MHVMDPYCLSARAFLASFRPDERVDAAKRHEHFQRPRKIIFFMALKGAQEPVVGVKEAKGPAKLRLPKVPRSPKTETSVAHGEEYLRTPIISQSRSDS